MKRKTRSLAFRVLSISAVFVIIPLFLYAVLVFTRNYQIRFNQLFEEIGYERDILINRIYVHEKYNMNILKILWDALTQKVVDQDGLMYLAQEYVKKEEITSTFYLEVQPDGKLICKFSTLPSYVGVDFAPYFRDAKGNMFIAPDPVFKNSLYLTLEVKNASGTKIGILASNLALDYLMAKLLVLPISIPLDIAIIDQTKKVDISSTLPKLVGKSIDLHQIEQDKFRFTLGKQKRYAIIAPIPNTQSALFLSLPVNVLYKRLFSDIWRFGLFLIAILIAGGIASFFLTKRMSQPLQELSKVMIKVGEGQLDQRYQEDRMGFEINFLGERFNEMVDALITYIEEAKRERAAREAYAKELEIGHEIQNSILPEKGGKFPGVDLDVLFQPAKEVAGDYYDWVVRDQQILFVIADGVGKSVSGALYAFSLRSILRSFATVESKLDKVVIQTNALFCRDTKDSGAFVTAFLASYDSSTKKLTGINCGHNYPIIKRASGAIERIVIKGTAFGVEEFTTVEKVETQLQSGDFIILFTDGITDAQNSKGELFTEGRLEAAIAASKATTPQGLIADIYAALSDFEKGADQYDDNTLIVFKVL